MTTDTRSRNGYEVTSTSSPEKASLATAKFRDGIWGFGIHYWMFDIIHRSFSSFADGYLSAIELIQLFTISLLLIGWICLKPEMNLEAARFSAESISTLKYYKLGSNTPQHEAYRHKTEARMLQLEKYHLISQEYFLPIPYLCQMYHLLNLKHLESVHSFSLNNLKVVEVSQLEATITGGIIKFQTALNSSPNLLTLLRQPVVEVELTLHTPYTVELNIPVYGGKKIAVMFNILPLSNSEHKLFIDIYSNLALPKPILQIILHFASSLTVFEDLPYLQKLAKGNIPHSAKASNSNCKTMQLFKRFVDLYGSSLEQPQLTGAIELRPI
jgi:hypothetical protein